MVQRLIGDIASRQHGLISYEQLATLCSRKVIRNLIANGFLVEHRRRVYAVTGTPRSYDQNIMSAVLAAGKGAFASHETAIASMGLWLPGPALLEVTTVLDRCPVVSGVRVHRSGRIEQLDVTTIRSIPTSSAERAIVELSSRHTVKTLGRIADEAVRRRLTTLARISETSHFLGRAPGRSIKKIAKMLALRIPGGEARESELEDFVFDSLRRFGLPLPVTQHPVTLNGQKRRIDLCYVEGKWAIEAQGFDVHGRRTWFDSDALRGNELTLAGYRVLEFTSAFTQWMIADQIARALDLPVPKRPERSVTFHEWRALR